MHCSSLEQAVVDPVLPVESAVPLVQVQLPQQQVMQAPLLGRLLHSCRVIQAVP
jgi:hypothetical protein